MRARLRFPNNIIADLCHSTRVLVPFLWISVVPFSIFLPSIKPYPFRLLFSAQVKQREREDMERAERELIDDFLGGGEPASKTRESEQKTIPSRAAELAATTGLGDGADIPQGAGLGIPADKSGDVSAPNALDAVSLATKEEVASFAKTLADKMNAIKNSANSLELLRVLSQQIGPALKFDDLSEFLRIVTVIKNEAQKAQQNKKKATKGKAVIKGLGSQYDDYTGSQYDDMF